jgi:hypothetical protein
MDMIKKKWSTFNRQKEQLINDKFCYHLLTVMLSFINCGQRSKCYHLLTIYNIDINSIPIN